MNTTRRSNHRLAPVIATLVGTIATASLAADGQLKWTPHRAAATPASTPDTDAAPAADTAPATVAPATVPQPAAAAASPSAAPAAVVLPDEVPRTVARRPVSPARPRPAPPQVDRSTANRISGAMQRAFDPANPNGVFGEGMMRTPQGDARRQILAPEGSQAVAMQQRAAAVELAANNDRLGGGLAPRYTATPGPRPRIDRLAMNADGIPSVMAQKAQVGALDDTAVPGRAPATGVAPGAAAPPAVETVPTPPPAAAPSAADEMPMSIESLEPGMGMDSGMGPGMEGMEGMEGMPADDGSMMGGDGGLLMGDYPAQLHVESFYDDPYACEDDDPFCQHSGRFCAWLRRFGKPYYGWRWYRDFTASAGVTAFTNDTNLGLHGNYGTNEYLNFAMPFWNAFGVGWQVGWRGTQTNFQPATLTVNGTTFTKNARDQNFVTTGFFTRAFEGRGLQGGAVYDYLHDSWLENADIAQVRAEISYVWGYHELGFWGAANITDQVGFLRPRGRIQGTASTVDLYTGFYRLQFGDANELKVWGGGTGDGEGIVGTLLRAPLSRSFAMEGTFTYLIPGQTRSIDVTESGVTSNFSPAAWNVGLNLVYYPAGRSRRGLASPYRPLFEVADNGSMIREFSVTRP
jgi:hypothetical protein